MDDIPFEFLLLEIIDSVFEKKTRKHIEYYNLIQKLLNTNKSNKLLLSKYLLGRLIRESERIFISAQNLAKRHCPACKVEKKVCRDHKQISNEEERVDIPEGTVFH